jgi:MinD-like ATPase involved in chromosome partitioning or flagellar assembly
MKLLILDSTTESQATLAKRIEEFSRSDIEMLDLRVKLVNDTNFVEKVHEADVLLIGPGVGNRAVGIAKQALGITPWLHIIMYVSEKTYGGGAFREAHAIGVRKVFTENAPSLDFLQELVAINADFRREGRARVGKVIAVAHAKGGVGATSITAALAEVCGSQNKRTMLWDLDVETKDLSRSLTVNGEESKIISSWVNGTREVSRESLTEALIPLSSEVSVLMPPDRMAEAMDLVCHTDTMYITQRIVELSKILFDVILVDTAGRMGPSIGALFRAADTVLLVIDDTVLGLTAVDMYLHLIKNIVGSVDKIVFLVNPYSGALVGVSQIAQDLEPVHNLGEAPWRLPPVPNDPKAALWPGSGRTFYSMGQKNTRTVLEDIASELGLIDGNSSGQPEGVSSNAQYGSGGWIKKLFGKKS